MRLERGSATSVRKIVLRGTAWLFGGRIARTAVNVAGIMILARLLVPADFGVFAVAVMIIPLSQALLEGLIDVPAIREDDLDRAGLANLIWTGVGIMSVLVAALWAAAPLLEQLLNADRLAEVLRVLCFGLLLKPLIVAGEAVLRRQHRFPALAMFLLVTGGVQVVGSVIGALAGMGVWSLVIGQLMSLLTTAIAVAVVSGVPVLPPRRLRPRAALRHGGFGTQARLLAWLTANLDTLFASYALGPAGAGIYSRAYNITTQAKEPFRALDQTVRQAFVAQKTRDDGEVAAATLAGLRLIVLVSSMIAATIFVLREAVVAILLGPQWLDAIAPLAVLAFSLPARIARMYLDSFTYVRGSMRHLVWRNIAILGLIAAGLALWAESGVVAIAIVVTGIHYASLSFVGGRSDAAAAGDLRRRVAAMAPGFAIGVAMIVAAESASLGFALRSDLLDWCLRASICAVALLATVLFFPDRWLPAAVRNLRHWKPRYSDVF